MYQPRRVADPQAPADTGPAEPTAAPIESHPPRHAVPTLTERLLTKGGVALAVVTATATAAVVIAGSTGDAAAALGTAAPVASVQAVVSAAAPAAPVDAMEVAPAPVVRAVTAEKLAAPAFETAREAPTALLSLTPLYTKSSVNVRARASQRSKVLGSLKLGVRVKATTQVDGKYRKVRYGTGYGWVLRSGLSKVAPVQTSAAPASASGTTWKRCSRGSAVERRLRKDTVHIYRSVCALFRGVNSYGGWRAGGLPFHRNGRALDIMVTPRAESALGNRIARYLMRHSKVFKIDHIIFEQRIWTPRTPRWRRMADRGSINANHYNHVHVAIRA